MFPKELDKRLESPERSSCGSPDDSYVSVKTFCISEALTNKTTNAKTLSCVDFLKLFAKSELKAYNWFQVAIPMQQCRNCAVSASP